VTGCLLILAAAPSSIGTVRSPGPFLVNGSAVSGNGTLFDGDVLETTGARSVVQLTDGQVTLGPASRARIFRDHTVLEQGSETLSALSQSVEADTLHIAPTAKESVVQVQISAPNQVSVTAREGTAEVRNSTGILVASMHPGMALAFQPQAASSSTIKVGGKLESSNGRFYLTDCNTKVRYELQGASLASHVGQTVDVAGTGISGAKVGTGVSQAVQVTTIGTSVASACPAAAQAGTQAGAPTGAPAGGAHAANAGVAGGLGAGGVVAIVGGVAVAGALGGLAAVGAFSNPPASTP